MPLKKILSVFALLLSAQCISALPDSLYLIPQPKKVERRNGVFDFKKVFTLSAVNTNSFYKIHLFEAIEQKIQLNLNGPSETRIKLVKLDSNALNSIAKAEKLMLPFSLGSEGYVLSITPQNISILATENAGVFYGVQTLIQIINANSKNGTIPCLVIYDKPDMAMRGWQDDISRGPIPTISFLKEEIKKMSSYKLNTFTLYTEHVFKLKTHADIAPTEGISAEEIKELVNFAKNYNVDIIGNLQSFGHCENILKVPGYEKMGENPFTLSPAKEETYKFLSDAYSEVVPAYESQYFHINCDEVEIGTGPSKAIVDSLGVAAVYANHINKIDILLKPYHKRIMMWGDIAVHNQSIIDRLPKDMIIVSWDYGPMESMDEKIMPFVKSGFQFIVAPGVSCWGRIYPDISRATINIYSYLRDGYKHNALGFINTTWDDSGQNFFNNNWYSLIWGADLGWSAPPDEPVKESEVTRNNRVSSFNTRYNKVYFNTDKDVAGLMRNISDLRNGPVKNCLNDGSLWKPLLPDYEMIPANYERDNKNLIKTIDSLTKEVYALRSTLSAKFMEPELLGFALRQARLVANKNLLGIKLKKYIEQGTEKNIDYFEKDFKSVSDTVKTLKTVYNLLWQLENRRWWLDTVNKYYNSFATELNSLQGACIITAANEQTNGKRKIQLRSAFNNLPVYYTLNGAVPDKNSTLYKEPLLVDTTVNIKARVIENDKAYGVESDSLIFHKGIGKLCKLNIPWYADNATYAARGKYGLVDGRRGNKNNFSDGRWQAYLGTDIDIELDLGVNTTVNKVVMGFAQLMRYGILFPKEILVSTSSDGKKYKLLKTETNTIDANTEERMTHDYVIPLNITTRYLKITAKNSGLLPEWHYAKGKPSWLFADEIVVE